MCYKPNRHWDFTDFMGISWGYDSPSHLDTGSCRLHQIATRLVIFQYLDNLGTSISTGFWPVIWCHFDVICFDVKGKTLTVLPWNSMHLLWQRKSVCFTTGSPPRYSRVYRFFFCFSAGIRWEKCAPFWACHAVRMYCIYWYILITYNIQSIPSVCSRYT
jgi:hypothetical protein